MLQSLVSVRFERHCLTSLHCTVHRYSLARGYTAASLGDDTYPTGFAHRWHWGGAIGSGSWRQVWCCAARKRDINLEQIFGADLFLAKRIAEERAAFVDSLAISATPNPHATKSRRRATSAIDRRGAVAHPTATSFRMRSFRLSSSSSSTSPNPHRTHPSAIWSG